MKNNTTTIKGHWWLPDKPEKKLAGEITYGSATGAKLSLFDHFFSEPKIDQFTVWGTTANDKFITLFDCHTEHLTRYLPGALVAEVSSYFGVVGGHFSAPADMKFAKATADLSYLHQWACTSGIVFEPGTPEKGWQVTQKILPNISFGLLGEFKLALEFRGGISPAYGKYTLSEDCFFTVEANSLVAYHNFQEVIEQFQHFVALGVARPVYALSIKVRTDTPRSVIQGQNIYEEYEIIRKLSLDEEVEKSLTPRDMQFCLKDLTPDASTFIKLYFEKHQLLEPVYDLYFATLYNPNMYLNQRLLSLAHAIEAYHRAFVGGKYQTNDEYRNSLQKILWDALPQDLHADFRSSLKNKLKYLHEFSLRKRVQDICGKFAMILKPFVGEPGEFAGAVANQRNFLTHPDSTSEERPPTIDWNQLWLMCEQLSLLLEVCLLHEIGFTDEAIEKLLPKNRRTRTIQLNRK